QNPLHTLQFIQNNQPNLPILHIQIPPLTPFQILSYLTKKQLNTTIIILTTFKPPPYFQKALPNHVHPYLLKHRSIHHLIKT
uniref:response regulator n=1 Tax=Staphylococcus epidermidis TaxID=1282 RepID=UPI0011A09F18